MVARNLRLCYDLTMVNAVSEFEKPVADAAQHVEPEVKKGIEDFVNVTKPSEHASAVERTHPTGDVQPAGIEALHTAPTESVKLPDNNPPGKEIPAAANIVSQKPNKLFKALNPFTYLGMINWRRRVRNVGGKANESIPDSIVQLKQPQKPVTGAQVNTGEVKNAA